MEGGLEQSGPEDLACNVCVFKEKSKEKIINNNGGLHQNLMQCMPQGCQTPPLQ